MSGATATPHKPDFGPSSGVIALDTSVMVAIVLGEPDREMYQTCLMQSKEVYVSTATLLEARIVIRHRMQMPGWVMLTHLLDHPRFRMIAPSMNDIQTASDAFLIYGKGSGHKAQLNFGDLFSYALAKTRNIPLLYKGDDFAQTDVRSAVVNLG